MIVVDAGIVVSEQRVRPPVLVVVDAGMVQVRGARVGVINTRPFRRDSWGEWVVDCRGDCRESWERAEGGGYGR